MAEKAAAFFSQPLPFALLQRYRLVNPNASGIHTAAQNNHILLPVVNALYHQWGVRITRNRLQALLDYLMLHFEIDMTIAESNLRRLVDCSEFTEPSSNRHLLLAMLIPHLRHMTLLCCLSLTYWQVVLPVVYIRDLMLIHAARERGRSMA